MKLKKIISFSVISIILSLILVLNSAYAQSSLDAGGKSARDQFNRGVNSTALGAGYDTGTDPVVNIEIAIGKGIRFVLGFVGVFFFILLLWGGFVWMKSIGNDQEIAKAKNIIKNATIGLFVVIAAYAITAIVEELITAA